MIDKKVEGRSGWGKKERRNKVQRLVRNPSRKFTVSHLTTSGNGFLIHGLGNGKDYHGIRDVPDAGF